MTYLPSSLLHLRDGNLPPLFRYGYPVNRALSGELAKVKMHGREFVEGMKTIKEQAEWSDLKLAGVLNEGFHAIVEFRNKTEVVEDEQKEDDRASGRSAWSWSSSEGWVHEWSMR
jgi:hypothetical protein